MTLYRLIGEESRRQPVSRLCRTLGVTPASAAASSVWSPRAIPAQKPRPMLSTRHRRTPRRTHRRPPSLLLQRSVESAQYTSFAFTRRLAAEGIVASMGTVGDALDNAMCESLLGTMKIEKLDRQSWRPVEDVRAGVFDWIEACTTPRRRHSSLGYLSPPEHESQHNDRHLITNP